MDVRLSLGTEISNNLYPVVITLKEPLIYQINNIDLFLVYDVSGSMATGNREDNLKKALLLVIDALKSKDRLTLISFNSTAKSNFELKYMNDENKKKAKDIVINTKISGETSFKPAIKVLVEKIKISDNKDKKGRVQSVIFLTDGFAEIDIKSILTGELGNNVDKYDFTVSTFGFSSQSRGGLYQNFQIQEMELFMLLMIMIYINYKIMF
jgi:hypothetical protein